MNDFLILMKPELLLAFLLFVLLFIKVAFDTLNNESLLKLINILLLLNVIAGFFLNSEGNLFGDMYKTNSLVILQKNILNLGILIISLQAYEWLKGHKHVAEFYMLMLASMMGMFYILSAGNLLMFYLALELSTIPLAAMANFNLSERCSSEAAMKLIMSSAFSSGLLLFGISMIYGTTGSVSFGILSTLVIGTPLQLFSFILIIAGFGFKISSVPFHLWTADVYEGSPVAVTSYLSVISKGTLLFAFTSVLYSVFQILATSWYPVIVLLAVLTMITGNLFAIRQTNIKRFLAFSSIAQVGFILVGISGQSGMGTTSVIYFVLVYIFSNLGAFGVVSVISALTGKENINDYKGLYKTNPVLSWIMAISLFSLAGVPPTAGFFGKFFLLMAGAGRGNYILITIAALNMVISLYYYLKIVKAIFMDENPTPIIKLPIGMFPKLSFVICIIGIGAAGLYSGIYEYIYSLIR
ncbi:MAG TPA: NADH-quinone oxidoreductase subunit N [Ferruginibacter sp.]|nr:NADH-quinone oxidoreductase subunit N [Ferruginibacter sp.]